MKGMQFVITPTPVESPSKNASSFQVQVLKAGGGGELRTVASKDLGGWLQTQILQNRALEIRLVMADGTPEPNYAEAAGEKSRSASG